MLIVVCEDTNGNEMSFRLRGIRYARGELSVRVYHLSWKVAPFDFTAKCKNDVYVAVGDSFLRGVALPKDFNLPLNVWPREHGKNLRNARLVDAN